LIRSEVSVGVVPLPVAYSGIYKRTESGNDSSTSSYSIPKKMAVISLLFLCLAGFVGVYKAVDLLQVGLCQSHLLFCGCAATAIIGGFWLFWMVAL